MTARYEIRVRGRISTLLPAFEGMTAQVHPAETVFAGTVEDQAALFAMLERVETLGLELVEVRQLPDNG
jgi:hypothetical protein